MEINIKKISSWCKGVFGIILFLIAILGLIVIIIYIINTYEEKNAKHFIDLLQIILSWPTLGIIALFIFMQKFQEPIRIFLANHRPEIPGTAEKQKESEVKTVEFDGSNKDLPAGNPEQFKKIEELEELIEKSNKEKAETEKRLEMHRALLEIYEFNYLALFFVDTTKRVLKWFFDLRGKSIITNESFNIAWQTIITDPNQRARIFTVLHQNEMIQGGLGGAFSITNKGEKFLKFIGFI